MSGAGRFLARRLRRRRTRLPVRQLAQALEQFQAEIERDGAAGKLMKMIENYKVKA